MRLGELLLQEKLITPEALEEALETQVVHGGRLGTNLVELGLLSEQDLAKALGKQQQCAFASGAMTPDPRALAALDLNFADDKDVLPMRLEQTRISVACINPHDLATLDEIGFRTGKRVVPVVIPEFRMNQLLRKYCKAFRTIRPIDLGSTRPSRTRAPTQVEQAGPDLMSEDEFQSLYAKALSGDAEGAEVESAPGAVPESHAGSTPSAVPESHAGHIPASVPEGLAAATPAPRRPSAPAPAPAIPVARVPAAAPTAAPRPPPSPPPAPLTFAEAQRALGLSADREDVAMTVLRFALGKWKRALLLNVQGPLVSGWHGVGQGIREKAVQRIAVALRGQSSFKLVCDTRSHFIGPVRRDAGTAVFYRLLGGDYPTTAVMLPLLVRGKVVHLLYVDNGPGEVTPPDIGELLILGQSVARSYEALINRRKSA